MIGDDHICSVNSDRAASIYSCVISAPASSSYVPGRLQWETLLLRASNKTLPLLNKRYARKQPLVNDTTLIVTRETLLYKYIALRFKNKFKHLATHCSYCAEKTERCSETKRSSLWLSHTARFTNQIASECVKLYCAGQWVEVVQVHAWQRPGILGDN